MSCRTAKWEWYRIVPKGLELGTLPGWAAMSLLHPEATVIAQLVVVCSCGSSTAGTGRRLGDLLPKDECP